MTPAEFLEWERAQPGRHQYIGGGAYAMAGGSPRHSLLAGNVLAAFHAAGRGGTCRAFSSDLKLHVEASGEYVYPDVTVVCGPVVLHGESRDVIENPTLVVEVLSKSTERYDRGEKWEGYRQIASLTDYLLVSQARARVEHFAREPDGSWRYRVATAGGELAVMTDTTITIDEIYEDAFEVPGDE